LIYLEYKIYTQDNVPRVPG